MSVAARCLHAAPRAAAAAMELGTVAGYGAWLVLAAVFAAAWVQGAEFASEKDSATFWGCVIGFAAFLAWLAVEDEADDDDSEGEEDEAADEAKAGEAKKER